MVRTDCVFLRRQSTGYVCTALSSVECESCGFFKTGEQQRESLRKSEERLKRLGLENAYRQPFDASADDTGVATMKSLTTEEEKRNRILSVLKEEDGLTANGIRNQMIALFGKGVDHYVMLRILTGLEEEGFVYSIADPRLPRSAVRYYLRRD